MAGNLYQRSFSVPTVWLGRAVVMFVVMFRVMMAMLFLLTFEAMFLSPGPIFTMLGLDALSVRARVRIMIYFTVLRRIFRRICMKWIYFCHRL
jgi:hypothetical protein